MSLAQLQLASQDAMRVRNRTLTRLSLDLPNYLTDYIEGGPN